MYSTFSSLRGQTWIIVSLPTRRAHKITLTHLIMHPRLFHPSNPRVQSPFIQTLANREPHNRPRRRCSQSPGSNCSTSSIQATFVLLWGRTLCIKPSARTKFTLGVLLGQLWGRVSRAGTVLTLGVVESMFWMHVRWYRSRRRGWGGGRVVGFPSWVEPGHEGCG